MTPMQRSEAAGRQNVIDEDRAARLRAVPLFESLDHDDLERLAATMHELEFETGSVITREGERLGKSVFA